MNLDWLIFKPLRSAILGFVNLFPVILTPFITSWEDMVTLHTSALSRVVCINFLFLGFREIIRSRVHGGRIGKLGGEQLWRW